MSLRDWVLSFVRKLHLGQFSAVFCKHSHAHKCYCALAQDMQHTQHSATVQLQKYVASYLCPELYAKTSVNGCDMPQLGLRCPGLVPRVSGDTLATRSELWLWKLFLSAPGPAARQIKKLWQEGVRRDPCCPDSHTLGLRESPEDLPTITASRSGSKITALCVTSPHFSLLIPCFPFWALRLHFTLFPLAVLSTVSCKAHPRKKGTTVQEC